MAGVTSGIDTKYCYISTTTSQSSSSTNYQNIPYRMETTTPVVYPDIYYMPIAIWSNMPVFKTSVYYNNGTNTVTYKTDDSSLLSMNQNSGPVMYGNGAGQNHTERGSRPTPFFGRYRESYGEERSNWRVHTGYLSGDSASYHYPPAAPIYVSAPYLNNAYSGKISVTVYNYAEYSAQVYIQLLAGSTVKYEPDDLTAGAMTVNSSKLKPGTCTFDNIVLVDDSDVRSITSIKVYWYSQSGNGPISYAYPVSFTIGSGSESCTCSALISSINTCICDTRATAAGVCICSGNSTQAPVLCNCASKSSKVTICSCSSGNTQINVGPTA